jgi:hypothetical protein
LENQAEARNRDIEDIVNALKKNKGLWSKIGPRMKDLKVYNHWVSLVKSRNHGMDFRDWLMMNGYEPKYSGIDEFENDESIRVDDTCTTEVRNLYVNKMFWKINKVNSIFPILDLTNHYHPKDR